MNRLLENISKCRGKKTAVKQSLNSRMPPVLTGGSLIKDNGHIIKCYVHNNDMFRINDLFNEEIADNLKM